MKRCCAWAVLFLAIAAAHGASAKMLRVLFDVRPPYYTLDADGTVAGLVSGPVDRALNDAGIPAEWVKMPSSRQLFTIRNDSEYACSPGWFRNAERQAFAKFSSPIYRDKPQVVAVRAEDRNRFDHATLAEILADTSLILGVKNDYSYGSAIDALIADNAPVVVNTVQTVDGMRNMLSRHRFDYFITAPEEFDSLADAVENEGNGIVALDFPDIPAGNWRYLMCAMQVDDDLIERFNAALEAARAGQE